MSTIKPSKDEKARIADWAKKNHLRRPPFDFFFDAERDSYFELFDDTNNFSEYGFDTLPELRRQLLKMWEGDPALEQAALLCAVAAFKSKRSELVRKDISTEATSMLAVPDFVYAF